MDTASAWLRYRKLTRSRLRRQFGTALAAARGKDCTACACAHTKAETVLFSTAAVIRLKGPLAHCDYSKTILRCADLLLQGGRTDQHAVVYVHPTGHLSLRPRFFLIWRSSRHAKCRHKGLHNVRAPRAGRSNRPSTNTTKTVFRVVDNLYLNEIGTVPLQTVPDVIHKLKPSYLL